MDEGYDVGNVYGDDKKSKYSSGLNIIYRLDLLWKDTHRHSRAGAFMKWNDDLDRIWLELARDLPIVLSIDDKKEDNQFTKKKKLFESFDTKLEELGAFDDNAQDSFENLSREKIVKRNNQYKTLMEKQLFLARLENELGKGTSYEDDDEGWD